MHRAAIADMQWQSRPTGLWGLMQPSHFSADLHSVMEHVHGIKSSAFKMAHSMTEPLASIEEYYKLLEAMSNQNNTLASLQRDVQPLQATYKAVVACSDGYSIV